LAWMTENIKDVPLPLGSIYTDFFLRVHRNISAWKGQHRAKT
jgi:hypothetical protein